MSSNIENIIPYITVLGEVQPDATVKFTLTHEQYFYIRDSLERAYHKRAYIREYKRETQNSKEREHPVNLALLLYMYDSEVLEPSIYYKQIKVQLVDGSITFQVSLDQAYRIQDVLQRRYARDKTTKENRQAKRPNACKRNIKRCTPVLIAISALN